MDEDERFYPASAAETYGALRDYVKAQYGIKSQDEFSMNVTFDAAASAWTSGQRVNAQVLPVEGGTKVRVSGAGKVRTQIGNKGQLQRIFGAVLDGVSRTIQAQRG